MKDDHPLGIKAVSSLCAVTEVWLRGLDVAMTFPQNPDEVGYEFVRRKRGGRCRKQAQSSVECCGAVGGCGAESRRGRA